MVTARVSLLELDQVESDEPVLFVCQEVEETILSIVDDLSDGVDAVELVEVDIISLLEVDPEAVAARGHHKDVLRLIGHEIVRLDREAHGELIDDLNCFLLKVELEYLSLLCEDERCW